MPKWTCGMVNPPCRDGAIKEGAAIGDSTVSQDPQSTQVQHIDERQYSLPGAVEDTGCSSREKLNSQLNQIEQRERERRLTTGVLGSRVSEQFLQTQL